MELLLASGYAVQLETNGTLYQPIPEDVVIVCSPKTGSINLHLAPRIDALKYVLAADAVDPLDGLPVNALEHPSMPQLARPPKDFEGIIFVQPLDSYDEGANKRNLMAAIKSAKQHGYVLCLQQHKIIGVE